MGVPLIDSDNIIPKNSENSSGKPFVKLESKHSNEKPLKDVIGNCKEFRIDSNRNNLRIIGNGNKIRINRNSGNLDIVGNDTRVKIMNNSGFIKYTGNCGRIYLGNDSSKQTVDYKGCNGILKVLKPTDMSSSRSVLTERQEKCKSPTASSSYPSTSSKVKEPTFLPIYDHLSIRNNISLPNFFESDCQHKAANITNRINLSCSTGSIINTINVAF